MEFSFGRLNCLIMFEDITYEYLIFLLREWHR